MINIENLVRLHDDSETIRRHRRLLEELFYLCINESFEDTVTEARDIVLGMIPDVGVVFPISNKETATSIRNEHLARNPEYQALLASISEKHRYYHPSFTRNYHAVESDADIRNRFNIIENILFLNDPMPESGVDTREHFNNRSGYMEIAADEQGPYINMYFDIGTTKQEIHNIIDKQFPETAQLQEEEYNIPNKQYRVDENLSIKKYIFEHSEEDDSKVAVNLESKGLAETQDNHDYVRMHKQRMSRETARFDAND